MCDDCGCGDPELVPVEVQTRILAGNDRTAAHNRDHFEAAGVLAVNLMGSPGAGKTAVLEATARAVGASGRPLRLAAVSGDLATDRDAARLVKAGVPAAAITTGTACHLDANMVHRALHDVAWRDVDVFVVENVGNLVCPAVYDLGQAVNVVALSVTEGEDKPIKYPVMFRKADLVLLTKCDLLPHLDVDLAALHDGLARVMPSPRVIQVSARTGAGIDEWLAWLEERRAEVAARRKQAHEAHGAHDHGHSHAGRDHGHGHAHGHGHGHDFDPFHLHDHHEHRS